MTDKGCGPHCDLSKDGKYMLHCYGDCCHGRPDTDPKPPKREYAYYTGPTIGD